VKLKIFKENHRKNAKFPISLFTSRSVLLALIDIGYFREYNDRFNFWLFNFFFDDQKAILSMIGKSYNLPTILLAMVIVWVGLVTSYIKLVSRVTMGKHTTAFSMATYALSMFAFLIAAARGSISRRPLQQIDVAITGNAFLNKCVPNSSYALYFAWKDFMHQNSIKLV
jgi:hypothetical protein